MPLWKNYLLPRSIAEALDYLSSGSQSVRLVAGGTDLLLELQQNIQPSVDTLIDVTRIPELLTLEIREGRLFVGAGLPVTRIVESTQVQRHAQALGEACVLIGGPQVRNVATLGGNVGHGLPAADGTIALLAYDTLAEAVSSSGTRIVPVLDLFLGPRRTDLEARRELLVGFHIPLRTRGEGAAFRRVMRPQGVALPILNMAIWLQRSGEMIAEARVAIGPAGPTPIRAWDTEGLLAGKSLSDDLIDQAYQTLLGEIRLRTSAHRAGSDYRRHLSRVLLEDCLEAAWERAGDFE
jgi:xanthine dehydrogenase FAD-binding subunit